MPEYDRSGASCAGLTASDGSSAEAGEAAVPAQVSSNLSSPCGKHVHLPSSLPMCAGTTGPAFLSMTSNHPAELPDGQQQARTWSRTKQLRRPVSAATRAAHAARVWVRLYTTTRSSAPGRAQRYCRWNSSAGACRAAGSCAAGMLMLPALTRRKAFWAASIFGRVSCGKGLHAVWCCQQGLGQSPPTAGVLLRPCMKLAALVHAQGWVPGSRYPLGAAFSTLHACVTYLGLSERELTH